MKKTLLGLLMVLALTIACAMNVMAGTPISTGEQLPQGSVEHYAWELLDNVWVPMGTGNLGANARAWSSLPVIGKCNKTYWDIPVTVHASVAQWVEFSINGTRYDWRVRKPGTYGANSLTATLKSNYDVEIDFDGFADLQYLGTGGVKRTIDTWYAFGEGKDPGDTKLEFIPAADLNAMDTIIKDSGNLHNGYSWKLWNKIKVENCNSACEYQDDANITLVLMNQKIWIDPQTGNFKD